KLEHARTRFRRAALSSGRMLLRVQDLFERVRAGQLAVDPVIDVVTSLGLSRDRILARLPHNLPTLKRLLTLFRNEFPASLRGDAAGARPRRGRGLGRLARKAAKLAEELSPRTELLERWAEELIAEVAELSERATAMLAVRRLSPAERAKRNKALRELYAEAL